MPIKEGIEYGVNDALTNLRSKHISTTPDLPLATRINLLKDKDPKRYQENMQRLIQAEKGGNEEARKLLGEIGEDAGRSRRGYEKLATAMTIAPMIPVAGGMALKVMNNPWLSAGFDVATGNYGDAAVGLATDLLPSADILLKLRRAIKDVKNPDVWEDVYSLRRYWKNIDFKHDLSNEELAKLLELRKQAILNSDKDFASIIDGNKIQTFKNKTLIGNTFLERYYPKYNKGVSRRGNGRWLQYSSMGKINPETSMGASYTVLSGDAAIKAAEDQGMKLLSGFDLMDAPRTLSHRNDFNFKYYVNKNGSNILGNNITGGILHPDAIDVVWLKGSKPRSFSHEIKSILFDPTGNFDFNKFITDGGIHKKNGGKL